MQKLWTDGEFPVHGSTTEIFYHGAAEGTFAAGCLWMSLRYLLRLIDARGSVESKFPFHDFTSIRFATNVPSVVHRFEESIGGRPYLIEVQAVSKDRWRAYIVRIPGVPTALMPFYGSTPDEAARLLSDWLTRAHQRASKQ